MLSMGCILERLLYAVGTYRFATATYVVRFSCSEAGSRSDGRSLYFCWRYFRTACLCTALLLVASCDGSDIESVGKFPGIPEPNVYCVSGT